jgi:hypothetical protein
MSGNFLCPRFSSLQLQVEFGSRIVNSKISLQHAISIGPCKPTPDQQKWFRHS